MARISYFQGDDIQQYLHHFEKIVDELKEGPYPIPFELTKQFVLDSLPGVLLKHTASLRAKEHTSMQDLCRDVAILKKQVIGEDNPLGALKRDVGTYLPSDLRHYKYTGNGDLPDGTLYLRSKKTCGACLSFGHKAYAPDCPQTEARLGLWGSQKDAQKPWDWRSTHRHYSELKGKDSRRSLGADGGRVSHPTTPGSGWGSKLGTFRLY
ncbi:hypothetical protein BN14_02286 [Rhizoctonia solani AG-1 IB]|uniref:Uncharacterized protein n=1 Tax=Thanatephorus cucumeris (strain AG1-IB / isolate 7/3/14) TaxID=1108050 RepID=M5BMX3_THACB|nr:hypothetical protein BN14_02286 [Rhizoctonia solani AG-1 IB]